MSCHTPHYFSYMHFFTTSVQNIINLKLTVNNKHVESFVLLAVCES